MAITDYIQPLDFWNVFVNLIFGGFWVAVLGLALLFFVIMMIGRVSIYSNMWFAGLFILAMSLGYGYMIISLIISLAILIAFILAMRGYIERGGQ